LNSEYTLVGLTSGALDDHPKWNPIAKTGWESQMNALNRSNGGAGVEVSTDTTLEAFNLCKEIGVNLTE